MIRLAIFVGLALASSAAKSEDQVRKVLADQQTAWNRGDVRAFMQGYENAESTVFVGATITRGYSKVLERYLQKYPDRQAMGTLAFSDLDVRMLGPEYASVIGRWVLERDAAAGGPAGGIFTLLLRRTPAGWRIILDHTQ